MTRIPEGAAPDLKNKSFSITVAVEIPKAGAQGMLVTQGGLFGGWGLFLDQGKPVFHYNAVDVVHYNITAPQALAPGKHTLVFTFHYDGGGIGKGGSGRLTVDGQQLAQGRFDRTIPIRVSLDEGLHVGEDTGTPVTLSHDVPFKFTGHLEKVTIDLR
jgi:arylsulfatase